MNISEKSNIPFEILVATTNRTSLDFIYKMFKNNVLDNYHVLIINQTSNDKLLVSEKTNIRVINSFKKGLSRSRNLAIQNAIGDICLLADDDVVYLKHFEKHILDSYKHIPEADIITFKTLTTEDRPYSKYPEQISSLDRFYKKVLSIEISFKRKSLIKNNLKFNEYFGLGSIFQDGENRLFFEEVLKNKKIKTYFYPEFIVMHRPISSSDNVASDRFIFARSAINYKLYGQFAWLYVFKLIFSLVRKRLIKINQVSSKIKVANQAIEAYKDLAHGK